MNMEPEYYLIAFLILLFAVIVLIVGWLHRLYVENRMKRSRPLQHWGDGDWDE